MLPPIPAWDSLHPLVVHFPIGLLLTVPVLLVIGLLAPRHRAWSHAALLVMALGTAGAVLAAATGEAASDATQSVGQAEQVLEEHEELGELARNLFIGLTLVYGAIAAAPLLLVARWRPAYSTVAGGVFLAAYLGSCLVLANAAHEGGRLVHEFGLHARLTAASGSIGDPDRLGED